MKILMLTWEYPPRVVGGISKVVHDLSHRLVKDGNQVYVVTYKDGNAPYFEDDNGVKVYRVDNYMIHPINFIDWIMQLNFNMITKSSEIIEQEGKFDIVHAHDWLVSYAAKSIKEAYKIPLVSTIHATEHGRNDGIHDESQRYINDSEWQLTYESTEVIVNSNFMKTDLQRAFGLPYDKITVIPNGVDLEMYKWIERDMNFRRNYAMDNEKIILYVGRLVYEKGIQFLIGAMPKILKNYHDAKLVVAGRGGMLDELMQETRNLGIEQNVFFIGYCEPSKVKQLYKCADIAVFPSTYEPFGIVSIESMLAGTPTVVSDVGGLNDIVEHGVNGMKSYVGNSNSIADSVLALLFDKKLCNSVSTNAIKKVKEVYNWRIIADMTAKIYEKAINKSVTQKDKEKEVQAKSQKAKKLDQGDTLVAFKKNNNYA